MKQTFKSLLSEKTSSIKEFRKLRDSVQSSNITEIKHLTGSMHSLVASDVFLKLRKNVVVVCNDKNDAEDISNDLALILEDDDIIKLVEPRKTVKNDLDKSMDHHGWILEGLSRIIKNDSPTLIVTNPEVFDEKVPAVQSLFDHKIKVQKGKTYDFDNFTQNLLLNGFDKKEYVGVQGDLAIRGGIVDIFPVGWLLTAVRGGG